MNIFNNFIKKYNRLNNEDKIVVVNQMKNFIKNIKKDELDNSIRKFIIEQKKYFIENFDDNEFFKLNEFFKINEINDELISKLKLDLTKEFDNYINYEYITNDYGFNGKIHIKFNIIYKNFVFNYEYIGYEDYKGKVDSKIKFNEIELSIKTCEIIENLFYSDLYPITLKCVDWYCEYKKNK